MKLGARDYLIKPVQDADLEQAVIHALESTRPDDIRPGPANSASHDESFVYNSSANEKMLRIVDIAKRIANTDVPVLISGESGVGKEVLARFVHSQMKCCDRPFIKVNCAALPANLLETELFGHERGAFTGANGKKHGQFELAEGGSLLLDEIGEMPPNLQAKLLHVLQDYEFLRVGGTVPVRVSTRTMATTNKPLESSVALGEFRQDLYYRLNVVRIEIPPLRERLEDVPSLCRHFVRKHRTLYCEDGEFQIPDQLMRFFVSYSWPGNIRQLENVIKRLLILGDDNTILTELRRQEMMLDRRGPKEESAICLPHGQEEARVGKSDGAGTLKSIGAAAAEEAEKALVFRRLTDNRWNRKKVARELGISYKTLLNKLHRWEMTPKVRSKQAGR
jgi:DNA-binding NtrC family response regulator